jgi:DNA-binding transcriptional MerR regulator
MAKAILMSEQVVSDIASPRALELFQLKPGVLYSLDATAHLAGVSRRSIAIYCRAGLVRPVVQPPYGVLEFTEEAIYTLRRIDCLHTVHGLDFDWIRTIFDLVDEVEHLRAELRSLRNP